MKKLWIALVLVYPHLSLAEFKPVATVLIHNPAELINQAVDLGVALETPVERATAESLIADILMAGETAGVDLAAPIEMFFYQDTQAADAMDPIYAARFKLLDDGAGFFNQLSKSFPSVKIWGAVNTVYPGRSSKRSKHCGF